MNRVTICHNQKKEYVSPNVEHKKNVGHIRIKPKKPFILCIYSFHVINLRRKKEGFSPGHPGPHMVSLSMGPPLRSPIQAGGQLFWEGGSWQLLVRKGGGGAPGSQGGLGLEGNLLRPLGGVGEGAASLAL